MRSTAAAPICLLAGAGLALAAAGWEELKPFMIFVDQRHLPITHHLFAANGGNLYAGRAPVEVDCAGYVLEYAHFYLQRDELFLYSTHLEPPQQVFVHADAPHKVGFAVQGKPGPGAETKGWQLKGTTLFFRDASFSGCGSGKGPYEVYLNQSRPGCHDFQASILPSYDPLSCRYG